MVSTADVRLLRAELARAGVFEHHTAASWLKFVAMLAAMGALLIAAALLPWWCALLLIPLAAVPAATAAMIGHEAGHGAFATRRAHNQLMVHLAFPLFTGLGVLRWKIKHNRLHHAAPNVVGVDSDLEHWPMALSSEVYAKSGRARRWFQRNLQGYLFWPLTLALPFVIRSDTWVFLLRRARVRGVDRAWLTDVACLVAHYVLWLVFPSLWFGVLPAVLVYLGLWGTVGVLLALVFAPAHMGLPVVDHQADHWLHQLQTTRDLVLPRWASWFFVGLDYQIEHHIFPRIPHQNLREARRIVSAWCAARGAPHQRIGYAAGVADVARYLFESWRLRPVALPDLAAASGDQATGPAGQSETSRRFTGESGPRA